MTRLEYLYDGCGALIADKNKGIANIAYDNLGYPKEIQFSNGNKTRYVYLPDGTKLKTTHITAIDGIVVPLSNTVELADYQVLYNDSTEYFGNIIYENGIVKRYIYDGGYVSVDNSASSGAPSLSYHYYVKDHLGNIRAVVNDNGSVEQTTHYHPSGAIISDISTGQSLQPNKYNGKELDRMHGLDWYDYGARNYDAQILSWDRMDPLCEKYYHVSPYVYCAGDPVNKFDPDGKSTWVVNNGDNTYRVIGGDLHDKDRNVYVYHRDKKGKYTVRGESIGQTTSTTSFYNSDKESWAIDARINMNDASGKNFLNKMVSSDVTLDDYISNARMEKPYDFKVTNGTSKSIPDINIYRGMSIGTTNGQPLISSARDIGNMAAGIVAAKNGISWNAARLAFDACQSKCSGRPTIEGVSTRNAEYYGWSMMHRYSNTRFELKNAWNSIVDFFKDIF